MVASGGNYWTMPVLDEQSCAGAGSGIDDSGRQRCSCLPFCFWGASSAGEKSAGTPAKRRRRRRRRLRLKLSWLAWPWSFRKKKKGAGGDGESSKGKKRTGRRLLLLFTASLQPKKALASVVSGDSALLPAKVSSFGDAKKQSNRKPRPTTVAGDAASSGSSSTTAATASTTRWTTCTAPAARARPETSCQPSPRPTDSRPDAVAGHIRRAQSSRQRHSFHHQFDIDGTGRPGGMWTAAATLGVIVLFGRVTAVVFLCSCLYGARFVRARAGGGAGAGAKANAGAGGSGSRRFGDPVAAGVAGEKVFVAEARAAEECKKKVVMAGFLERAGKAPSSRFGR